MVNTFLYIIWALAYLICGALGALLPGHWVGIPASILFFLPPAILLYRAKISGDLKTIRNIRVLSLVWLGTTALLLILNILSVALSAMAGDILYYTMVILTSPMVCGQYWLLSIFLWACLQTVCAKLQKQTK